MSARPNWCRRVCSPTESLKGNFPFNYVSYLLIVSPFFPPQGHQKAWKVRAQTAPASLSCVPRAAFIWKMNISSTNSSHLCIRDHPALSFLSPPQLSLLLVWSELTTAPKGSSQEWGRTLFLHQRLLTKQKKLDCRKDVCDGLFYYWSLKKKKKRSPPPSFLLTLEWCSVVELLFSTVYSWEISLPVMVVLLSTLTLN